jgi:glyoxylase-like metal-dependent hydrolase (beta-lactamase superfamily II)
MKTFVSAPLLLLAAFCACSFGHGAEFDIKVKRLSARVAVFYGDQWDNAIVAIATQKSIVVVDAPFSKTIATGFRDAIQAEFKRNDFAYLINSHEHPCHIGGNCAYADLLIVGHESLRREMLKMMSNPTNQTALLTSGEREIADYREFLLKSNPAKLASHEYTNFLKCWKLVGDDYHRGNVLVPPTLTFDRQMTLYLGDVTVRLMYYGYAHSVSDTIISIPEENLVLTAGIFYPNKVPEAGKVTEGATPQIVDNWFVVMHGLLNEADGNTRFIASHGRAIMRKEQCALFVSYLEKLWTEVRRAKAGGKTLEQTKTNLSLQEHFPEVAKLQNQSLPGTQWEVLDIHQQNIEHLWKVLEK